MGVVFRHTVEALVVGVAEKKKALPRAELTKLGVFPPRDVPMEVWVPAVRAIAAALFPSEPTERQLELLGRQLALSFAEGVIGRGLLLVLRLLGRRRALLRMAENFRTADSATTVTAVEKSPTWVQVRFSPNFGLERNLLGIMRQTMEMISPKEGPCSVELAPPSSDSFAIDVKW